MATFKYKARDLRGAEQQGSLVADSQAAAVRVLDERGLFPIRVWEDKVETSSLQIGRRVKLSELAGFYNQLGDLLAAGVPMLRALDVLARQQRAGVMAVVTGELREDVAGGASIADAMEKHTLVFPELHVGMVRAGEQGGFLNSVLHRLASFVEQRDELRNKVIGAMIYPLFLLAVGLTVVLVAVTYFMPKLEPMFAGMELPALTKGVMGFGNFLREYYLLIIPGIALSAMLVLPYLRSPAGRKAWHRVQFRLPVVGNVFRMVAVCRFCRVLGTLLGNGVSMMPALTISRESAGNVVLAESIADAAEAVRSGKSLSQTLRSGNLFPLDIIEPMAVAEQTNRLDVVLVEMADRHEQRVARKVDVAVRMLEPALLLVVFSMVMVIAMALLLPIMRMRSIMSM